MLAKVEFEDDFRLDRLVEGFWSLESIGIVDEDEGDALRQFLETTKFNKLSGRYQVSLPWRQGVGMIADNYTPSVTNGL
jgi:hypothetical protein